MSRHFGSYRFAVVWTPDLYSASIPIQQASPSTQQVIVGVEAWVFKTVQMECHYDIFFILFF